MKFKKLLLSVFVSSLFLTGIYAQEETVESDTADIPKEEFKLKTWDFFFTMGPHLYVNTNVHDGAPSPIMFSMGLGLDFFNDKIIHLQTKASFFTGYYLWNGERALPAEIENRTGMTYSLLFDLDGSHTWIAGKNAYQAGAGISVLGRFCALSRGVDDESENENIKSMNSWFWSDLNFLYPNVALCWMRQLDSKWHAGFEARFYLPLGSLKAGRGLDNAMATFGIKVTSK